FVLTFAAYSALFGPALALLSPIFAVLLVDGCAVFGFSTFCAWTRIETCQSANAVIIASAKTRILCRDDFVFMAYSRRESFSGSRSILQPGKRAKGKALSAKSPRAKSQCLAKFSSLFALCPLFFALLR